MSQKSMFLLQQVRVIDPVAARDFVADVLIVDDRIEAIEEEKRSYPSETKIINGDRLILGTGLVDLYSYSGEPGFEARETLFSLAASASAGGFTAVGVLPNTNPTVDNLETLTALQTKVQHLRSNSSQTLSQLYFWTNLALKNSQQMSELGELSTSALGFTQKLSFTDLALFKQALEYLKPSNKPIAVDISANQLTNGGVIREGKNSIRYGMVGNPDYSEAAATAASLEIIASLAVPVHIMGISTARGVELIQEAKQRGVPVTASTTWMHLLFDTEDLATYDPNLRLEPPLGNPQDRQALREGVKTGIIDAIAIAHRAYTYEEKTVPFATAPPGVIGLELALPILWQEFVQTQIFSAVELWQALSMKPRLCWQMQPLTIKSRLSDLVLFSPQQTWQVNRQTIHSLGANTLWWGREIQGKVIAWEKLLA